MRSIQIYFQLIKINTINYIYREFLTKIIIIVTTLKLIDRILIVEIYKLFNKVSIYET